ncbi:hypothetical protein [Mesorhizobium sp. AR07]|nr:hypothetical protein [Mesorhizobium sp. AR07]
MSIESPFFILSEDSQPARCSNIAATSQVANRYRDYFMFVQ